MLHIRIMTIFLALTLVTTLTGCSQDKHTFKSTVYNPTSVAVLDTARETTLWQMDIPVEHKLVLDFDRMPELEPLWANMRPATRMSWRLYSARDPRPQKWDTLKLPGTPIKMRVTYRPSPEFPPQEALARGPAQPQMVPADVPTTEPTAPTTEPASESTEPANVPTTEPTAPTTEPASESTEPADVPTTEPTAPTTEPASESTETDESQIPLPGLE